MHLRFASLTLVIKINDFQLRVADFPLFYEWLMTNGTFSVRVDIVCADPLSSEYFFVL